MKSIINYTTMTNDIHVPKITAAIVKVREGRTQTQVDDLLEFNAIFERDFNGKLYTGWDLYEEPENENLTKTQKRKREAQERRDLRNIIKMKPSKEKIEFVLNEIRGGSYGDKREKVKLLINGVKNYRQ